MRAASLHRFLPNPYAVRAAAFALMLTLALIAPLVYGATGAVAASGTGPSNDWSGPFRWLT